MTKKLYYGSEGLGNILKLILPYLVVVGAFQQLGSWVAHYDSNAAVLSSKTLGQAIIIGFFNLLGHVAIVWVFRKYVDKKSFRSLGFQQDFPPKDILIGIIIGFEVMFLGFMSLTLTNQLDFLIFQYNFTDLLLCLVYYAFVAFTEELLMRGYVLNNLLLSFNKYLALGISALLFSFMHLFNPDFTWLGAINLFLAGILLGLSYIFTKNLWFPIALHFSWNFFQGPIFGFRVSGNNFYSFLLTEYQTPNIWNGGAFGFEGSVLCTIIQLITIGIVFGIFKDRISSAGTLAHNEPTAGYFYEENGEL